MNQIAEQDLDFIRGAVRALENPGLLIKVANSIGRPLELLMNRMPRAASNAIDNGVNAALRKAAEWAVLTLPREHPHNGDAIIMRNSRGRSATASSHTLATGALGAIGGAIGFLALPVELPLTTVVMLRSIASISVEYGFEPRTVEGRLECVAVLGMAATTSVVDRMESSYLSARVGLAAIVREAGNYVASRSAEQLAEELARGSAPQLVRLLARISERFGVVVTDAAIAQLVPLVGAVGGALVNATFTDYFNSVAEAHFGIRRLEGIYGEAPVRVAYREVMRTIEGDTLFH